MGHNTIFNRCIADLLKRTDENIGEGFVVFCFKTTSPFLNCLMVSKISCWVIGAYRSPLWLLLSFLVVLVEIKK